jgi:hypothetical protein
MRYLLISDFKLYGCTPSCNEFDSPLSLLSERRAIPRSSVVAYPSSSSLAPSKGSSVPVCKKDGLLCAALAHQGAELFSRRNGAVN